MQIYKDGIYKTIDSSEYGLYLQAGFIKVEDKKTIVEKPATEEVVVEKPKVKSKKAK
jgi:hypothetical protein